MSSPRPHLVRLTAAAAAVLLLGGCTATSAEERTGDGTRVTPAAAPARDAVVAATWRLGVQALRAGEGAHLIGEGAVRPECRRCAQGRATRGRRLAVQPGRRAVHAGRGGRRRRVGPVRRRPRRVRAGPHGRRRGAARRTRSVRGRPVRGDRDEAADDARRAHRPAGRPGRRRHARAGVPGPSAPGYSAGALVTDLATQQGVDALSPWVRQNTGGLVDRTAIKPDRDLVAVLQDAVALAAACMPDGPISAELRRDVGDYTAVVRLVQLTSGGTSTLSAGVVVSTRWAGHLPAVSTPCWRARSMGWSSQGTPAFGLIDIGPLQPS